MRPDAMEYNMGFAIHASTKSKDTTRVGAALFGPEGELRLTGYNGPARGVHDLPERFVRPVKYLYAVHAEQNIIAFAARQGIRTDGCTLYVTHCPCASCMCSVIQSGIRRVVFGGGSFVALDEQRDAIMAMAREAGVALSAYDDMRD